MTILSIMAFQRRSSPLVLWLMVVTICAGIWDFGFAVEIISPSLQGKIFWANVQFLGITFLPVAWLAMTMHFTGQPRRSLRIIPALGIIPAITNIVIWSNPYHHLFRGSPYLVTIDLPFPVLNNDYRPFFYAVHAPYGYILFAVSLFLLVRFWKRAPAIYRRQRFILIISLLLPLLLDLLYVLGITPIPAFNFTPVIFSFSGLLIGWSVLYLRILDILPLAYETVISDMDIGVIVIDAPGRVTYLNPAVERITGVSREQAVGTVASQVFPNLEALWDSTGGNTELSISQGGEEHTYQIHRSIITKGEKRMIGQVVTLHDVTERVKLYRQVEEISITDPLTGVFNRRVLTDRCEAEIQRAIRYGRSFSLILLDVDNFKAINDQCGHKSGDDVLRAMVKTIRKRIRANDQIFRFGGDEFVVLLPETSAADAMETAGRIQDGLTNLSVGDEQKKHMAIYVSQGVTSLLPGDTLETLLQRADTALYQAKEAGKKQAVLA